MLVFLSKMDGLAILTLNLILCYNSRLRVKLEKESCIRFILNLVYPKEYALVLRSTYIIYVL